MEIEIDNSFNYASSISEAETNSDNIINSSIKKGDIITADNLVNPDIIKKCEQCYEDVRNSDYNREQNNLTKISNAIDSLPKFTEYDLKAITNCLSYLIGCQFSNYCYMDEKYFCF